MIALSKGTAVVSQETAGWPLRQRQLQARCVHPSGNFTYFEDGDVEQSISARFEQQAARHAGRVAVRGSDSEHTYHQLNEAANRLAHEILARCGSSPGQINVMLEQGVAGVVAMLAIFKAGKTYVPLDPALPTVRLAFMVEQSEAQLMLADAGTLSAADEISRDRCAVLDIGDLGGELPSHNPNIAVEPGQLAWIVYTSGSTGQPKGVMQTHRNVLHSMRNYTNYFGVCPEDRLSVVFSFATHGGNFGVLIPLTTGASLFPIDLRRHRSEDLAAWMQRESITVSCMVPTVFRRFGGAISPGDSFPSLRLVYVAGEPVLKTDFELYRQRLPRHCLFVNRLGSTEMDCIRLFFADHDTTVETITVPVGFPVRDKHVTLTGDGGAPVAPGDVGEICVESRYIALGYWRRPDLTAAAFEEKPDGARLYCSGDLGVMRDDGSIVNLGRKDFQVKIRGYRVETAEIETALLEQEDIKDAVVAAFDAGEGEKRLAAYVVPRDGQRLSISQLRIALTKRLPDYMVPAAFVVMPALPQASNGKILRRGLPLPGATRPEQDAPFIAPRTAAEKELAAIWSNVLGIEEIGVEDHLLDLGADSIRAMQIATRIQQQFNHAITISELIRTHPTIAALAKIIPTA